MVKLLSARNRVFVLVAVVVVIFGLLYSNLSTTNLSIKDTTQEKKQKTLGLITALVSVSQYRPLAPSDFSELSKMVEGDETASRQVKYATWFSENGITNHMSHKLGDLYNYIDKGQYEVCIPHEIEHMLDYITLGDSEKLQETLDVIVDNYQEWFSKSYSLKQRYPNTYAALDQVVLAINSALTKIKNENYQIAAEVGFIKTYSELGCSVV